MDSTGWTEIKAGRHVGPEWRLRRPEPLVGLGVIIGAAAGHVGAWVAILAVA